MDDGNRGARLIEGNGITLIWAPAGPGWNANYYSWNDIAYFGVPPAGFGTKPGYEDRDATIEDMNATGLCVYLSEDGLTVMDEPQYIWRMPLWMKSSAHWARTVKRRVHWDGKSEGPAAGFCLIKRPLYGLLMNHQSITGQLMSTTSIKPILSATTARESIISPSQGKPAARLSFCARTLVRSLRILKRLVILPSWV